jgi:phosphoserine phosphatase
MAAPQNVIAVIFDFDDTLTDDSTTLLLKSRKIDTAHFWGVRQKELVDDGWDPTLAYMTLILQEVGAGKPLGNLTNTDLRNFGTTLQFYTGLPDMFAELRAITADFKVSNPKVEIFIVSGGLEEVIRGSSIAGHVDGIYGCRFAENKSGVITSIKNVISFTEKTRFIFEINKGIGVGQKDDSRKKPYDVNHACPSESRRVPLSNMIYVGDGLTDVPCFSLIEGQGGNGFGVFDAGGEGKPKKAWQQLLAPKRTRSLNAPKYGPTDDLGAILRMAVNAMCAKIELKSSQALS